MFGFPDQAVGTIVAAIIAGIIALLGLIISKEQKVSEFRQQWIDALRQDIAAVIRYGHCMSVFQVKKDEDFACLTEAAARIRLRLNRKEPESAALLAALDKHFVAVKTAPTVESLSLATDELVVKAQVVLKQEWRRVRSGERVYRITWWATVFFIVALAVGLLRHLSR